MLKAVARIDNQEWLSTHETKTVFMVLNPEFDSGKMDSLFVGGCVRNAYIDKEVTDIDICTRFLPDQVEDLLKAAKIKSVPTGKEHGTITAVLDKCSFEITTLRRDDKTDGRHAEVSFTKDWREDALRRDFTMNTLLADINGNVYDPTGEGISDLDSRRVIFVGEADQRIKEDYLRILRYFRFNAWYGASGFDEKALAASKENAKSITKLSAERVTTEVLKILSAPYINETLEKMRDLEILPWLFYDDICSEHISATTHPLTRLVILANAKEENLINILKHLRLSNHQEKTAKTLIKTYDEFVCVHDNNIKQILYFYGHEIAREWLNLRLNQDDDLKQLAESWEIPKFPISGETLLEIGIDKGPALGEGLRQLEQQWIKNDFDDSSIDLTAISLLAVKTSK